MSEQETRKGRLNRIEVIGESSETTALEILKIINPNDWMEYVEDFNGDVLEALQESSYDNDPSCPRYMVIHKKIYEVLENIEIGDYFCELTENPDETISFLASWYNGGACLEEVLGEAMKEIFY